MSVKSVFVLLNLFNINYHFLSIQTEKKKKTLVDRFGVVDLCILLYKDNRARSLCGDIL